MKDTERKIPNRGAEGKHDARKNRDHDRLMNGAATLYLPEEMEPQDFEEMQEWLAYVPAKLNRMEATQAGNAGSHKEEVAPE